ncbi:hypothetical protein Y032_0022g465 [Ancylostoma ceylanicum]|nr:hypothetical protein Y032_0022g465 [Ancylostoma ceylanicum]
MAESAKVASRIEHHSRSDELKHMNSGSKKTGSRHHRHRKHRPGKTSKVDKKSKLRSKLDAQHKKTRKKTPKKEQACSLKKTTVKSAKKRPKGSPVEDRTQQVNEIASPVAEEGEVKEENSAKSQQKEKSIRNESAKAHHQERIAQAKEYCQQERAMEGAYTLFERTAAPKRPAVVIEPPLNVTCEGKPINASAPQRRFDSRVERLGKSIKSMRRNRSGFVVAGGEKSGLTPK